MSYDALFWFIFNIFSIVVLAFYSMLEMACVSFNKVRLQYYVSKKYKRALWLNDLLQHPSRLFGTTLIGVNIALVVGSECSREFYAALGLSPAIAPLTQVVLVVIFGELAPMFAARHYPEHVAMLGIPLIYASARLMTPLLAVLGWISKVVTYFIRGNENEANIYLTQEELQKLIEGQDEESIGNENVEFSAITTNIFSLRHKDVKQVMEPLTKAMALPSNATVEQMEILLRKTETDYVLIYHRELSNIIGIIYPRDVLRISETKRIRDYAEPPWFVTETANMMQILKQFRTNNENVAVILDQSGKAIGLITLKDVLSEILGTTYVRKQPLHHHLKNVMLVEKTFSGDTTVEEFNRQYHVLLDPNPQLTLSELMMARLGHHPERGESIYVDPFELTVKETTLLDIRALTVSTRT